MKLRDIISISPEVLEAILMLEIKKIPGLGAENIKGLKVNDKDCSITISITPFNILANIYSLAFEIQQTINFYLSNQFDIKDNQIKINIIVLAVAKE